MKPFQVEPEKIRISPKCKQGWPNYISADGQWFPCWFVSHFHRYWKTDFFFINRKKFNLNKRGIEDILSDPVLKELEDAWTSGDPKKIPYKCRKFCGKPLKKKNPSNENNR